MAPATENLGKIMAYNVPAVCDVWAGAIAIKKPAGFRAAQMCLVSVGRSIATDLANGTPERPKGAEHIQSTTLGLFAVILQ
jgi:hypothetical protein